MFKKFLNLFMPFPLMLAPDGGGAGGAGAAGADGGTGGAGGARAAGADGGAGGAGGQDGGASNPWANFTGAQVEVGGKTYDLNSPDDLKNIVSAMDSALESAKSGGSSINDQVAEILKHLQGGGQPGGQNNDKDGAAGGDKGGKQDPPAGITADQVKTVVAQMLAQNQNATADSAAAEKYLKDNNINISLDQVQNWADLPETRQTHGLLTDRGAAMLMSLPAIKEQAEKTGRAKGAQDRNAAIRMNTGQPGAPKNRSKSDLPKMSDDEFWNEFSSMYQDKGKQIK